MSHHPPVRISMDQLRQSLRPHQRPILRICAAVCLAGIVMAAAGAALSGQGLRRLAMAYLVALAFVWTLSLGALFFVLIQHLTRAGWSVLVRRLAEAMAANMLVVAALSVPVGLTVAAGSTLIYPWAASEPHGAAVSESEHAAAPAAHAEADSHASVDPVEHHQHLDAKTLSKRPWLTPGGFLGRWVIYLSVWCGLGWYLWRQSRLQDADGAASHTLRCETIAGPAVVLYAVTVYLGSSDLLMSLNPHWYSAVFGIYVFSGAVIGVMATLILLVLGLQRGRILTTAIGTEHLHDLGKLLFAFVFFWGYIAYSQYMLLWYAHLPETTSWLVHRGASSATPNGWTPLLLVLLAGHLILPFAVLLSRHIKRRRFWVGLCAGWLLVAHWLDLVWLVMPETGGHLALGLTELGMLLTVTALWSAGLVLRLSAAPLVPVGDPRLVESLGFENV